MHRHCKRTSWIGKTSQNWGPLVIPEKSIVGYSIVFSVVFLLYCLAWALFIYKHTEWRISKGTTDAHFAPPWYVAQILYMMTAPPYGHGMMTQKGTSRSSCLVPYTLQTFEVLTLEGKPFEGIGASGWALPNGTQGKSVLIGRDCILCQCKVYNV